MDGQYIASDGKLKMRALTLEDSQLIVDWRNNPRVRSRYIYREPFTLEGQERYFHEKVESGETRWMRDYLVIEVDGTRVITH